MRNLSLIAALLSLILILSCRDYISDVFDNSPPEIFTNAADYVIGDTVKVTFKNNSASTIYVTGAYNTLEKKNFSTWETYSVFSCTGGCPEFPVYGKSSIHERFKNLVDEGTYRFVCAYSPKTGEIYEKKNKVYSSEFSVFPR